MGMIYFDINNKLIPKYIVNGSKVQIHQIWLGHKLLFPFN